MPLKENLRKQFKVVAVLQGKGSLLERIPEKLDEPWVWMGSGFIGAQGHELLALDFKTCMTLHPHESIETLRDFWRQNSLFSLGWLTYELGEMLVLGKTRDSLSPMPLGWWGEPRVILWKSGDTNTLLSYSKNVPGWLLSSIDKSETRMGRREPEGCWLGRDFPGFRDYCGAFRTVMKLIREGECYQVNLTERRRFEWQYSPLVLMRRLLDVQAPSWSAFWTDGKRAVLCTSPEMGLIVSGHRVRACPMKGTRPRWGDSSRDRETIRELRDSAKERAENLMVVDMWRNELSRICRPGSVQVPCLFRVEVHPTVLQMVSDVTGILEPEVDAWDCLNVSFPSPSVTGAPKRRAMEWIQRLETSPRGVYCGLFGWLLNPYEARWNVAIRTAWWERGIGAYGVGGGIVADSDAYHEWQELEWKTRAFTQGLCGGRRRNTESPNELKGRP